MSITAGLPFLVWLRLAAIADKDSPADLGAMGIQVPALPELPELPVIPKTREIPIPLDKLPANVSEKLPAEFRKETKAGKLIDLLPWNR